MISKSLLSGIAGLGTVGTGGYAVIHFGLLDSYIPAIPSWKLGLPSGCVIPTEDDKEVSCEISKQEELTGIQFKETAGKTSLTVTGLDASGSDKVTLKIKKFSDAAKGTKFVDDSDTRFSFTFTGSKDIEIKESGSQVLLTLKKGTNPEFKVKFGKLERAWTPETLISKTGKFTCTNGEGAKCTLTTDSDRKLKIKTSENGNIQEVTVGSDKLTNGFTVAKNVQDYNQGFKFTYAGSSDENLDNSVTISQNSCFEVKYDESGTNGWHLAKKSS